MADRLKGAVRFDNAELDDLVIARAGGGATYHLAAVVDDIDAGVTHVLRGDDHFNNTPRQLHLYAAFGAAPPAYVHLPMILDAAGRKLSKRAGDVDVLGFRERGVLPSALLNALARLGWAHGDQELFDRAELVRRFGLDGLNRAPARLDPKKLAWLNREQLRRAPAAELEAEFAWHCARAGLDAAIALDKRYALAKIMAVDTWVAEAIVARYAPAGSVSASVAATDSVDLTASAVAALAQLTRDPDADVRAVAAAALHAVHDNDPAVAALLETLVAASPAPASRPGPFRTRWAAALTQWGASAARSHGAAAALPFLEKASRLRPTDPETLIALAAGLAAGGDHARSVEAYQQALHHQSDHPVALVNLGLGLESLGREVEAEAAYQRALEARPGEALAHFNLGNARFRRGDLNGAAAAYRAAVEADPGLARAHFYLAVSLINTGNPREALPALRTAAEFAPDDDQIRQVLQQVEAALRGAPRLDLPSP